LMIKLKEEINNKLWFIYYWNGFVYLYSHP
jgi:hypothetical protein